MFYAIIIFIVLLGSSIMIFKSYYIAEKRKQIFKESYDNLRNVFKNKD